jgi:RNA-binding protein
MDKIVLTGAQKSRLRGLGQRMEPSVKVGKDGLTPAIIGEVQRQLGAHELVKLRYVGSPREERAAMSVTLSEATGSAFVGSVGQTALFFTPAPSSARVSLLGPAEAAE